MSKSMRSADSQYQAITKQILKEGNFRGDRTGTGTYSLFGAQAQFDLSEGLPILSSKQVFAKTAWKEMLWMISGDSSILPLIRQNVHIWSEWPHKNYCDSTGSSIKIEDFEAGLIDGSIDAQWAELGPVYGVMWRKWETKKGKVIDQLQEVIDTIKNNPSSRRIIMEGWNVGELENMLLPPCHKTYQWHVDFDELGNPVSLNSILYQRSADWGAGVPFNWVNQALLTMLIARECGLKPGKMIWQGVDVHIYSNHVDQMNEQLARMDNGEVPECNPQLEITGDKGIFEITIDDLKLVDYQHAGKISLPIAV